MSSDQLPTLEILEQDLIRVLIEPPDGAAARELSRDIGRRLRRPVSLLLLADALRRLARHQRRLRPQDKAFLRSALLHRLEREPEWIAQPIEQSLPEQRTLGEDDLPNGTWSWVGRGLSVLTLPEGRWAVLHLLLRNDRDAVAIGQPTAIFLADEARAYAWSPLASARVPGDYCPDACRGSLASIAVEPRGEILGHLSFPLPTGVEPMYWGLLDGDMVELRPCIPPSDVAKPPIRAARPRRQARSGS